MKQIVVLFILVFAFNLLAQDKPAYVIYTKSGKKTTYSKMIKAMESKKAIFFGELHDNPIAHWLELEVLKKLYLSHGENLVCGSEMFESDNQKAVSDYVYGKLDEKQFKDSCRLWSNFETDYKPMLDFAKMQQKPIPWIATNIPRKYASMVYKKGLSSLDSLSFKEKAWMCPLPYKVDTTLSQYAALTEGEMHMGKTFVYSQAIKDATMAYFISQNMKENSVFYHINGSYHSDFHQSILWYLNYYSKLEYSKMLTISTVTQENIDKLDEEYLGKADFIICVPEAMTRTQ
jgi:uncharacterized iron-regulated protein